MKCLQLMYSRDVEDRWQTRETLFHRDLQTLRREVECEEDLDKRFEQLAICRFKLKKN